MPRKIDTMPCVCELLRVATLGKGGGAMKLDVAINGEEGEA